MTRWFAACSLLVVVFGLPAGAGAQTRTVTLEWDPSTDLVAGYVVYVGTHPQIYGESYDVGTRTSFVYPKGILGERYYFAVASYETTPAIAGAPSLPISTVIPGAPTTIVLQPPDGAGFHGAARLEQRRTAHRRVPARSRPGER